MISQSFLFFLVEHIDRAVSFSIDTGTRRRTRRTRRTRQLNTGMEAFNLWLKVDFSLLMSQSKGCLLTEKSANFGEFYCSTLPSSPVLPLIVNLQYFETALLPGVEFRIQSGGERITKMSVVMTIREFFDVQSEFDITHYPHSWSNYTNATGFDIIHWKVGWYSGQWNLGTTTRRDPLHTNINRHMQRSKSYWIVASHFHSQIRHP